MRATNSEIKATSQIWTDVWNLWKKYYHPEKSEEFWSDLVDEADAIGTKYKDNDFVNALLLACVNDIERRYKERR